jgi:hypothetical protein
MPLELVVTRQRLVVLLAVGALVAYVNSFSGVFLFDDVSILSDTRLENLPSYISHLGGMIRPAVKLTYVVDRVLWGGNPVGYHLLNVLLHLGSGMVVYTIILGLVRADPARCGSAWETAVPFWSALLFLLHPVGTETVTYLSGRATGLMSFFYLASLSLYLRASGPERASAVSWSYLASIGCFLMALLSKETALTFPLALLLVEAVARGRRGAELRDVILRFHLPFWGVLLLCLSVAAFNPRYVYLLDTSLGIRPLSENLLTQVNVVAYALSLFVLPGRLSIEHDIPLAHSMLVWPTSGALLLLAGLIASAVFLLRSSPLASFGLFWFFLQLLPTSSVLPRYDLLSERNLYLPAPGLFLALVSLWVACLSRVRQSTRASQWRRIGAGAMRIVPVALVPVLVAMTIARNDLYADPVAFWSDAVQKAPAKARPHVNLGHAYYVSDNFDGAIAECRIALAIDRDDVYAQATLRAAWRRKSEAERLRPPAIGR